MAAMLTQLPLPLPLPLPLVPDGAAQIAPGVGLSLGGAGGLVWVHGLATFAWDGGDEASRRLAAVQLVRLRAASQAAVAAAFGVDPVTVWRWDQALSDAGLSGLVPGRKGAMRPSKLTAEVVTRIRELDGQGLSGAAIARAAGVSASSVSNVPGRIPPRPGDGDLTGTAGAGQEQAEQAGQQEAAAEEEVREKAGGEVPAGPPLTVLPDPVPRGAERALARRGLLGEAAPVFAPGARYPLAGLLLALPALEAAGLLACARSVYGRRPAAGSTG